MDFQFRLCQDRFVVPSLFPICWASPPETPSTRVCYTCGFPSFCPRGSFRCGSTVCRGQIHELKNPYLQGNSGCKDGVAENGYHENTVVWDVSSGWRVSQRIHHKGGCILFDDGMGSLVALTKHYNHGWLETMSSPTALEAQSPRSWCQQGRVPSEASREGSIPGLSLSLAHGSTDPVFTWHFPCIGVSGSKLPFIGTSVMLD